MPINRYLLKKEKAFEVGMYRIFRQSKKELQELLRKQDRQKAFGDDLRVLIEKIVNRSALFMGLKAKPVLVKGTKETAKYNPDFKIDWNVRHDEAVRYIDDVVALNSNTLLKGSVGKTTHDRIMKLIREGVAEGMSYTEVADNIEKLDPLVFSKNRAEVIAINEMGYAYEKGKNMPMKALQDKGEIVLKKWQTVEDERVRPAHMQNQADGYIPLDMPFSGTGSQIAPFEYRCRCAVIYSIK